MTEQTIPDLSDIAARHDLSKSAVGAALRALRTGQGRQAQFNHPDLSGMGQWSQGGMLMIGDMFNDSLKARVAALFEELAPLAAGVHSSFYSTDGSADGRAQGWPTELGAASSSGSQNDMHYAVFPEPRRLAIQRAGQVTIYDIGDRRITGVSQQQSHHQTLCFTGPDGAISTAELNVVGDRSDMSSDAKRSTEAPIKAAALSEGEKDIASRIDQLHGLLTKGALTPAEFDGAKRKLLGKL